MAARDSKSPSVTIRCNVTDAVRQMVDAAQGFAIEAALETVAAARLVVIVEELVTNIAEHGGMAGGATVDMTLNRSGPGVATLTLLDCGVAFDPRAAAADGDVPDRGGGAGIALVRAWSRAIEYRREGGRNRLRVEIPID